MLFRWLTASIRNRFVSAGTFFSGSSVFPLGAVKSRTTPLQTPCAQQFNIWAAEKFKETTFKKVQPFYGPSQINIFTSSVWNAGGDRHTIRLLSELWTSATWDLRAVSHGAGFELGQAARTAATKCYHLDTVSLFLVYKEADNHLNGLLIVYSFPASTRTSTGR